MLFDYLFHNFDKSNFRLVMTILVKNEEDIIKANIKTHSSLGVDAFVIMDNDSTDNTKEIIKELSKEYEIVLIEEKGLYSQAKWMKKLASIAKTKLKADWVISNDADEFWIPNNDLNLKENLAFKGNVITCHRYNMILQKDINFFDSVYRVENPIFYSKQKQLNNEKLSIILTKIGPKVIFNPNGLLLLRGGNHKALHIANFKDYLKSGYDKIKRFESIEVFHYPIRSYEQFKRNIENRKRLLESNQKISMGPHYRRWVNLYNQGKLEEEFFNNIIFTDKEIKVLEKYDILKYDEKIKTKIVKK